MKTALLLTLAVTAAATSLAACSSVDESAPSHPRTANILTPDQNAKDNADKRILESPGQTVPTGAAKEFPGQSQAPSKNPTILASDAPTQSSTISPPHSSPVLTLANYPLLSPTVEYNTDNYNGPIPHLPEKPGTTPSVGAEAVPNTPWMIDNGWGEVLPMQNYPHRAWPESSTTYLEANIKNNPTYYFHIEQHLPIPQADGSVGGDIAYSAYEIPWFLANTAILPVLMVLDPPFHQRTSDSPSLDPLYNGYLPPQGDIVPTPTPGIIRWEYSFLKNTNDSQPSPTSIEPATTNAPGLDKSPSPADTIPATTAPAGQ